MKPLSLIVAIARGEVIGKQGGLPWHVPEDLKFFKATTMGHALIMGRRTHESIGRVLPGRRNIVVTRGGVVLPGAESAPSLEAALTLARTTDTEPMVIGGAALYREALPGVTRVHLTEIDRDVDGGDTFLHLDRSQFDEVSRRAGESPGVTFLELIRKGLTA